MAGLWSLAESREALWLSKLVRQAQDARQRPPVGLGGASCDIVFPISANAFRLAWERVKKRPRIEDLRFHDIRHEAISRFFEIGLSVPEVALISGHKDTRMLSRYTHLRAEEGAKKLGWPRGKNSYESI